MKVNTSWNVEVRLGVRCFDLKVPSCFFSLSDSSLPRLYKQARRERCSQYPFSCHIILLLKEASSPFITSLWNRIIGDIPMGDIGRIKNPSSSVFQSFGNYWWHGRTMTLILIKRMHSGSVGYVSPYFTTTVLLYVFRKKHKTSCCNILVI